jgi:hypothetical protein
VFIEHLVCGSQQLLHHLCALRASRRVERI